MVSKRLQVRFLLWAPPSFLLFITFLIKKTQSYQSPFKHFELNEPLTDEAIAEICKADVLDPKKENLNYDGTRALDGGEGTFRSGIKDGGKAKKIRCYVTK